MTNLGREKRQLTPRWKQKNKSHTNRDTHRFFLGRWVLFRARWIKFPLRPFFCEACCIQQKTFSSLFAMRVQFFARCVSNLARKTCLTNRETILIYHDMSLDFSHFLQNCLFPARCIIPHETCFTSSETCLTSSETFLVSGETCPISREACLISRRTRLVSRKMWMKSKDCTIKPMAVHDQQQN